MRKISEGAEAEIYGTTVHGMDAIVKVRISKGYRVKQLDEDIRTQRTKAEARMLAVASMGGARTPKVLMLSRYEIFMNRLRGRMLNAVMKDGIPADRIIVEVGRQLALLHSMNIVHGDYTPANILVDGNDVWVIDFGLGGISASAEEKALDVLLMKRSMDRKQYRVFEASYAGSYGGSRAVLQRLKEIELRGRYQTRTLMTR